MKTKRKTILIYNFKRVLSLILSFFLFLCPLYAYSQTENDRNSTRIEDESFELELSESFEIEPFEPETFEFSESFEIESFEPETFEFSESFEIESFEPELLKLSESFETESFEPELLKLSESFETESFEPELLKLSESFETESFEIESFESELLELENILFIEEPRTPLQNSILNNLIGAGITTLNQLKNMTEEEILKVTDKGRAGVEALQVEMEKLKNKCNKSFDSISKK